METNRRTTWETYMAAWNTPSATDKHALFARCLASDCVYADPLAHTRGWNELVDYMNDFHRQVPGGRFLLNQFSAHHDGSLATWNMVGGDGAVLGNGMSYGEYTADGRLVKMVGFFDTPGQAP